MIGSLSKLRYKMEDLLARLVPVKVGRAAQFGLGNVCPAFASKLAGQVFQCRNFVQQARGRSVLRIKTVSYLKAASATMSNKSLKLTAHVCHTLCRKAKPAPYYGSLIPPLGPTLRAALTAGDCTHPLVSLRERSLTIAWSRPECRQASLTPDWRLSRRPFRTNH
jgi:hypothetical protein